MTAAPRRQRVFTAAEYLTIERDAPYKSEFLHGEIIAMAGASENHISINFNLGASVRIRVRGTTCRGFGIDMKVRTSPEGLFGYPDLTLACGRLLYHDAKKDVLINPAAIFEILSPSTASFDRGEKFVNYQELESLRDYILISQDTPRVEHYARKENDLWQPSVAIGLEASITLSCLALTLPLAEIYEDIVFAPPLSLAPGAE